jgi:catechol 2,3-dioxygenase-like lactoylglutathione lyase family enzyme
MSVSNLAELVAQCGADGYKIAVKETELRPGVKIAMVEDPDGNWVEFLQIA